MSTKQIELSSHVSSQPHDPWEAYLDVHQHGQMQLSSIELTTTHLCNMRCEHCAVGYGLDTKDPQALPLDLLLRRLDELPQLRTLSITGGEPMLSRQSVENHVLPLLRYAHKRGVKTQLNSNLTLNRERYEPILPYLDVLHISYNYGSIDDFAEIGFAMMQKKPPYEQRVKFFERMVENARTISQKGVLVSAETMINQRTLPHLEQIHDQIVNMGCGRHEVHPMYPTDFAGSLQVASLPEIRTGIHRLLNHRQSHVWMLFGTLPFYACSDDENDLSLLQRLHAAPNVTLRNDPDGRSRLNVNIFNGDIIVTDFADTPPLGNIKHDSFQQAYEKWMHSAQAKALHCHCPSVECLGPNALVKDTYYPHTDFRIKQTNL